MLKQQLVAFFLGFGIMVIVCIASSVAMYGIGYTRAVYDSTSVLKSMIDECQKELPRTQHCIIVATIKTN